MSIRTWAGSQHPPIAPKEARIAASVHERGIIKGQSSSTSPDDVRVE
jgi:hypothetical protein